MKHEEALRTLELQPDASAVEVKDAYRRSLELWHPDRFLGDAARTHEAHQQTQKIIQAYRTLARSDRFEPEWFELPIWVQLNPFRRARRPRAAYANTAWERFGIAFSLLGMLVFTVLAIVFDW